MLQISKAYRGSTVFSLSTRLKQSISASIRLNEEWSYIVNIGKITIGHRSRIQATRRLKTYNMMQ